MGVSTTPALELGIDVGVLEACVVVGYPGTRASFFQQSGRVGRKDSDSVVFLIGLDTSVNQYIMSYPEYIFDQCIEQAVIEPVNPFVVTGHLRCATYEKPLSEDDADRFGPYSRIVLDVLEENMKVQKIEGLWYYASSEIPNHEVSLRSSTDANVIIQNIETGAALGEIDRFDAEAIVHPEAIYMHRGDTYRVIELDLDKNIALVKREETDYYTQPLGGTDIHHVDQRLKGKPFGTAKACWGEVTAHFNISMYEKIHFYSLDAISRHGLNLPTMILETMAFWIVPPEELMEKVRDAHLDAHSGLRGIGYATRMILPLFITCDVRDFSHTIGSVNSEWNAIFVFERYPHGLGFTDKAYGMLDRIIPAVFDNIRQCKCDQGCPCCVGKPLRQFTTWNVERGEASIPSKASALMILEGLLGDRMNLKREDSDALTDVGPGSKARLEQALRRRLERMREPQVFHTITPAKQMKTGYPDIEKPEDLEKPDVARRAERRRKFDRDLHKRIAKKIGTDNLAPNARRPRLSPGMRGKLANLKPTDFPGQPMKPRPGKPRAMNPPTTPRKKGAPPVAPVVSGDPLAERARKKFKSMKKKSTGRDDK